MFEAVYDCMDSENQTEAVWRQKKLREALI